MIDPYITRAVLAYEAASPEAREAGATWYAEARRAARRIALEFGKSHATVGGMLAATSPANTWKGNVSLTRRLLAEERQGTLFPDERSRPGVLAAHMPALAIRDGAAPLKALRGPKVRAFYAAIMQRGGTAVVDRWMMRVLGHGKDSATPRQYADMAAAMVAAAALCGADVHAFQGALWVAVRGGAD